ncbi:MAG: hypothetical protein V7K92_03795 [Nostoc sp.]|uniref:hypothetical protein n=1 Tax=Nostoc sp. TaxID=1180 RepID=UPI002FEFDA35
MTSAFARFPPRLQAAIVSNLGWSSLRPVQELAGHTLLDGNNAPLQLVAKRKLLYFHY